MHDPARTPHVPIGAEHPPPEPSVLQPPPRLLYFDSLNHGPRNLRFIVDEFGADRVMIGSEILAL
ncbi:MAG TPA: hypothetical protein VMR23_12475 [Candidatus Limnocylindria bacterium]|nr:hypothetical protein [Candidatus Limnocylindria bacterium]